PDESLHAPPPRRFFQPRGLVFARLGNQAFRTATNGTSVQTNSKLADRRPKFLGRLRNQPLNYCIVLSNWRSAAKKSRNATAWVSLNRRLHGFDRSTCLLTIHPSGWLRSPF